MQIEKDGLISSKRGNDVLTFSEKSHRYKLNGKPIRSVTGIGKGGYPESHFLTGWKIGQGAEFAIKEYAKLWSTLKPGDYPAKKDIDEIIKSSKMAWTKKSEEAANIGTLVHDYAYCRETGQKVDNEKIQKHPDCKKIRAAIGKFDEWYKENSDEVIGLEWIVASTNDWYAGKFDRLSKRMNRIVLTDYKTSSGIFIDMFFQLALYKRAIKDWLNLDVDAMEIVRFGKDGAFETKLMDDPKEIEEYTQQALRNLDTVNFKKKYEGDYGF